jgi:hypothetical protein
LECRGHIPCLSSTDGDVPEIARMARLFRGEHFGPRPFAQNNRDAPTDRPKEFTDNYCPGGKPLHRAGVEDFEIFSQHLAGQ